METRVTLQPYQRPPEGQWDLWIFKAGRNTGKTLAGGEFVMEHLRRYGKRARVGVMAPTQGDVIATCAEGETGIITRHRGEFLKYNRTSQVGGEAFHKDGGYVRFLGGDKPGRWNGPQWSVLWIDEAELVNPATIDQAEFGLRLGAHPQAVWTTTPKGSRYVKKRQTERGVVTTRATIYDNKFASPAAVERLEARYGKTSLGKSQLYGIDLDVPEGAIWPMLGEDRSRYLRPMPEDLHFVRHGTGIDWGTSAAHLAAMLTVSVTKTGELWVRRAWRSPTGSSRALIDRVREDKEKQGVTWAAIDRSQWSLADFVEEAGVTAIKGDRNVDWRAGLVLSALEHNRLFFDSTDPGVMEAYDHLTQYHRDDDGDVVEEDDDDADALCYVIAECEHPTLPFEGVVAGTVEHREGQKPGRNRPEGYSPFHPVRPPLQPPKRPPAPQGRPGRAEAPARRR